MGDDSASVTLPRATTSLFQEGSHVGEWGGGDYYVSHFVKLRLEIFGWLTPRPGIGNVTRGMGIG